MTFREWLEELAYPVMSSATLVALVTFALLLGLAAAGGMLGIWLAIVMIPAFLRYLTMIAEARARNTDAAPPGIEFFSLVGNFWTLFPTVPVVLAGIAIVSIAESFGTFEAIVFAIVCAAIYPAMIAVLVITHSPLQSMNPPALYKLVEASGFGYGYAPLTAILIVVVPLLFDGLPLWLQTIAEIYLLAAFFAVCGAITRKENLIDDVDIPDALEPGEDVILARLEKQRTAALSHAYGFIARDNRTGGLEHVYSWLRQDPDPGDGWAWFLEQMLRWENKDTALFFAQQYLKRLLADEQQVVAVKVMMRCRLVNERFKPLAEDRQAAIEAAQACHNDELAAVLERG
jgi:hypothetical protein